MQDGVLIGYRRGQSKKGNDYCMATVVAGYNANDLSNGCAGSKAETYFLPDNLYSYLKPEHIGKPVELDFEISNGRAFLVGFSIAAEKKGA